ncbi:MAG: DUF305 domain-containing protein [Brevundimonas sp.]|uniref:DUF305 domain-containing protein n=1 Tax=Brevundimonas sp. TaxID=1871086 RepID=UPI0027372877|nr:DUF305 domain-containing protein [Brevundimonas sp.]MDP3406392.1 DUF305 domain-containing protein [Brevundimonas sp.]
MAYSVSGLVLALMVGLPAAAQTPPIFQPGAPGTASRTITAAESVELSRTTFIAADAAFMQHMIVHHAQAVEMVALLQTRGSDPVIARLGQRISLSQDAEIALMREWLQARGQPLEMPDAHAGHGAHAGHAMDPNVAVMAGMLSPAQMQTLAAASGPAFDRLFLAGMIQHHQGAIDMVNALMAEPGSAEDPLLSDFIASVIADQSAEILRMQSLLSAL